MDREPPIFHLRLHKCNKCGTATAIKDMTMKMGGLLCPKCRVILFEPYVDEEYFEEYRRRQAEEKDKTQQKGS